MTLSQSPLSASIPTSIYEGDLPDNNLHAWVEFINSPRNHLMFYLAVIGVGRTLQKVKHETLVQVLTPCGIINLHSDYHVTRGEPWPAPGPNRYISCPDVLQEDLAVLLRRFAKKEARKPFLTSDPYKPSRVCFTRWLALHNDTIIRELLFDSPGVGCAKKKKVVREFRSRNIWLTGGE